MVQFINHLNHLISDSSIDNSERLKKIQKESYQAFELINTNIEQLNNLEKCLNSVSQDIINLLINVDNNQNNHPDKHDFLEEIHKIEESVNTYSSKLSETNSAILLSDIKIDTFLNNYINKTFICNFEKNNFNNTSVSFNTTPSSKEVLAKKETSDFSAISGTNKNSNELLKDNKILVVSEKTNHVFLPYTVTEINRYLEQYPNQYSSFQDVVKKEFVLPLNYYMKHPVLARFRETYSLIRDRESKSIVEAIKYAFDLMFKYELNPTIIASCKTQEQLENYLDCLDNHKLDDFHDFEIKFEITPL